MPRAIARTTRATGRPARRGPEDRQDYAEDAREDRQDYYDDWDDHGHYYYDNDWAEAVVVGVTVGAVVAVADDYDDEVTTVTNVTNVTNVTALASLPCEARSRSRTE